MSAADALAKAPWKRGQAAADVEARVGEVAPGPRPRTLRERVRRVIRDRPGIGHADLVAAVDAAAPHVDATLATLVSLGQVERRHEAGPTGRTQRTYYLRDAAAAPPPPASRADAGEADVAPAPGPEDAGAGAEPAPAPPPVALRTRAHVCSECGESFASGAGLGGHRRKHRPRPETDPSSPPATTPAPAAAAPPPRPTAKQPRQPTCPDCGYEGASENGVRIHQARAHKPRFRKPEKALAPPARGARRDIAAMLAQALDEYLEAQAAADTAWAVVEALQAECGGEEA